MRGPRPGGIGGSGEAAEASTRRSSAPLRVPIDGDMKAVNLLPSEQRGSAKTAAASAAKPDKGAAPFGAYVVLGALAFAVVATALSVLAGNTIKDRKAELARVTTEAQATQAKATSLQAYADFATLAG